MKQGTIDKLMEMGARRWTKGEKDRLYLNAAGAPMAGLEISRYRSGSVSSARLDGETITNARGSLLVAMVERGYIDLTTDKVVLAYPDRHYVSYAREQEELCGEKIRAFIAGLEITEVSEN